MLRQACGCTHEIDEISGALKSKLKCDFHSSHMVNPESCDLSYYETLSKQTSTQLDLYLEEMKAGAGEFPTASSKKSLALEIGPGISPYAQAITKKGFAYFAVEPSRYAANHLKQTYGERIFNGTLEDFQTDKKFELVISAHSLEHMPDAISSLQKIKNLLRHDGTFILLIPDDTDLCNPDHLWFFNEETISRALASCGFEIENICTKRITTIENFIYARCRPSQRAG